MTDSNPQLVQRVRESMAGTYDVLGHIGTDGRGAQVLLGRDLANSALVGISVTVDATDPTQYAVDVQRSLGKTVTVDGSMCPECRTPLPELDAFCFHCGANLQGAVAAAGTPDSALVLQALATATAGRYEILGRLDREGSTGAVYFARELDSGKTVALRLKRVDAADAAQPDYVRKLTQIFDTGDLEGKIAKRQAQQAVVREAAERAGAERAAAERETVDRAAAERAAQDRAATQRAATERAAADRIASAQRAASERIAAERASTYVAPVGEFSLQQDASTDAIPSFAKSGGGATADAAQHSAPSEGSGPGGESGSSSLPRIAGGVTAVLAVLGYFVFSGDGAPSVVTSPARDTVSALAARPTADTNAIAFAAAGTLATTAGVGMAGTPAPTDSGTIRVVADVPADARITVDGKIVRGRTLRVSARSHQVAVAATGFEPYSEKLTVAAGATVRWSPKLVAITAATASGSNGVAGASNAMSVGTKKGCRDLARSEEWTSAHDVCTTEANGGNAQAAATLGRMYARGAGVARDGNQSVVWYRKAASDGDHEAQAAMGYALRDGNTVKRDEAQSAQMFRLAAEGGEKQAQLEWAVALEKGDGVAKDQAAARGWYRKAADQGIFMAARRLGRLLEKGDGGPKSEPEALALYEKAATLGDAESAMTVGKWYRDGKGVTQSPANALTWFRKALELGHKDAPGEVKKLQK